MKQTIKDFEKIKSLNFRFKLDSNNNLIVKSDKKIIGA